MMQQVACIEPTTDFSVPDHLGSVGASVTRERAARPIPAAHPPTHTLPAATVRPVLKSMSLEQEDGDDSGDEVCGGVLSGHYLVYFRVLVCSWAYLHHM